MSSFTERKVYRPKFFIRKNDKFSPFHFEFLLNLFDLEFRLSNNESFPRAWKTTFNTEVTMEVVEFHPFENNRTTINRMLKKTKLKIFWTFLKSFVEIKTVPLNGKKCSKVTKQQKNFVQIRVFIFVLNSSSQQFHLDFLLHPSLSYSNVLVYSHSIK